MKWKNININKQNVDVETLNSVLIKMPHNSDFDGYKFWHPAKLVRKGRNSNSVSISYNDEFIFNLKKYGNGKYNKREVIDEIEIDTEEFENVFNVMNENIISKKYVSDYETHKPKPIKPVEPKVEGELLDD